MDKVPRGRPKKSIAGKKKINELRLVFRSANIVSPYTLLHPSPKQKKLKKKTSSKGNVQLFEVNDDHAIYPISLETIKFTINTKADKQEYNIPIEGIYLHYKGLPSQTTDIDNLLQSETAEKVLEIL